MKIAVCIPCLLLGGSEVATLQMVQALTACGHSVTVMVYYEHDMKMVERYRQSGAEVTVMDLTRGGWNAMIRLLAALRRDIMRLRPDVVHGVYMAPGMIPLLAARAAGVRHVFTTVHAAGRNGFGWKAKAMFSFSAWLAQHVFCVSEQTERFWFGGTGRAHSVIENGIDLQRYSPAERKPLSAGGRACPVIGIVGRIVAMKGHDCLFRAAARLMNDYPSLTILVVGDGAERVRLEKRSEQLGIAERVVWAGRVEPEELPAYYRQMDVLAMPSRYEGFGLTAAEAMASGVPVAATNVEGLKDVVGQGGILVDVDDERQLADALDRLLKERDRYSRQARTQIETRFNLEMVRRRWQEAYSSLCK